MKTINIAGSFLIYLKLKEEDYTPEEWKQLVNDLGSEGNDRLQQEWNNRTAGVYSAIKNIIHKDAEVVETDDDLEVTMEDEKGNISYVNSDTIGWESDEDDGPEFVGDESPEE